MSTETPAAAHDTYTHHEDGQVCVLIEDGTWFIPYDVGGEGVTCERQHGPDPARLWREGYVFARGVEPLATDNPYLSDSDDPDDPEPGYHNGVIYGIQHPGPTQAGCPYCADTLEQKRRWGL